MMHENPTADPVVSEPLAWAEICERYPDQGSGGKAPLMLVLDTGSWQALIVPDVMDALGFNPRDGLVINDP